jgi:hypothetical protein
MMWFRRLSVFVVAMVAGCAAPATTGNSADNAAVYNAWVQKRSYVEVTASGSVARVLGTRPGPSGVHTQFLVHLGAGGNGLTVRVADNVDMTGRLAISPGDSVVLRGEYIYDPRGGLIHWTHRDPRGRHEAGYVSINGRYYQ